jgi:hypothetical protein
VKQLLAAVAVVTVLALPGQRAWAHDAYSDAESNPLKLLSYPVAAAGFLIEWTFTRPIHFLVSQPTMQRVFNYEPTYNAFDTPDPYPSSEPDQAPIQYIAPPPPAIYTPPTDEPIR